MAGSPVVGIDLGTTNSAIGILEGERVRLFPNALGDVLTPSAVAVDPKTKLITVGRTAKELIAGTRHGGALRFKIDMGTARKYRVRGEELDAVTLSAHVLDALRSDAERALGQLVTRCVITVPAYFDDAQRHATRQAAEQAGFVVERIVNEPTAAAIAYGLHQRASETLFAVVDLGGGTFDVCVMELFEGVLQVKSVAGESRLGGEDFTEALARHLAARAEIACPDPGTVAWALLFKRAELAKRALARWPQAEVTLAAEVTGAAPRELVITAEEADRVWAPWIDRLRGPLRAALNGAGIKAAQLADVVLVGGATRMPCVRRAVAEILGREPVPYGDPDLLVAHGAAIQAAMIDGAGAVEDLVVTDVASHSLGVGIARRIGVRHVDGYFSPIVHRNTVIPTSRWAEYSTIQDDQRVVELGIYEGDHRRVEENRQIGKLVVSGIPLGPAGRPVRVRLTYDQNGMLEVEAEVVETGKRVAAVFHRTGGEVTGDALERARSRLRAVRADPMDRPRYRDLLARAKLLWQECDDHQRHVLDDLLDALEAALDEREPRQLESCYQALLGHCEAIDHGERW